MLIRKDMDLNENERISKITIRHKLKKRSSTFIAVLHFSHSKEFINEHITHTLR
jgi:hypothetical protein